MRNCCIVAPSTRTSTSGTKAQARACLSSAARTGPSPRLSRQSRQLVNRSTMAASDLGASQVPRAVLLVFRGEAFRWGLDSQGVAKQHHALHSIDTFIVQPFQAANLSVRALVTFHIRVRGTECLNHSTAARLLAAWHGPSLVQFLNAPSKSQAIGVRTAMDAALQHMHDYGAMIMLRTDLTLRLPLDSWDCASKSTSWPWGKISFSNGCGRIAGNLHWNCTSDVLQIVPRRLMGAFSRAIGRVFRPLGPGQIDQPLPSPGCCFADACMDFSTIQNNATRHLGTSGHDCWNALRLEVSEQDLDVCWHWASRRRSATSYAHYLLPHCSDMLRRTESQDWRCGSAGRKWQPESTSTSGTSPSGGSISACEAYQREAWLASHILPK